MKTVSLIKPSKELSVALAVFSAAMLICGFLRLLGNWETHPGSDSAEPLLTRVSWTLAWALVFLLSVGNAASANGIPLLIIEKTTHPDDDNRER